MIKHSTLLIASAVLLLGGCSLVEIETTDNTGDESSASSASEELFRETSNVTYTGIVQPAGISIYMQGSHRLSLLGGKFILLESDAVDLNGYVNEEVQIYGSLRPTVEAGGMIMRVERIVLLSEQNSSGTSSSMNSSESTSSDSTSSGASFSVQSSIEESSFSSMQSAAVSSIHSVTSSRSTSSQDVSQISSQSSKASDQSPAFLERLEVMVRQDYATQHWTQKYCTSHVGFCVPVHRNFWFKSFGATETSLWHVEISSEPVENLFDGPIVMELLPESMTSMDGTVLSENGTVVAYKEWTFGRHFRITASDKLTQAVTYMMQNITEFTQ